MRAPFIKWEDYKIDKVNTINPILNEKKKFKIISESFYSIDSIECIRIESRDEF